MAGGRYLLTDCGCTDETGHKDLEVREGQSVGLFVMVSESEDICLFVCSASHTHGHYSMDEKKKLVELLHLKEVTIPAFSIFVGYGYFQHVGYGWRNSHSQCYHTFLILTSCDLKCAVVSA